MRETDFISDANDNTSYVTAETPDNVINKNFRKIFTALFQCSSNINEVIKAVLNSSFFYEKILHTIKALKTLKALNVTKTLG